MENEPIAPVPSPQNEPAPAAPGASSDLTDAEADATWNGAQVEPAPAPSAAQPPAPSAPTPPAPAAPAAPGASPELDAAIREALDFAGATPPPAPAAPAEPAAPAAPPPAQPPAPAAPPPSGPAAPAPARPSTAAELVAWADSLPQADREALVDDPSNPDGKIKFADYVRDWAPHLAAAERMRRMMGGDASPAPSLEPMQQTISDLQSQVQRMSVELEADRMLRTLEHEHGILDAREIVMQGDFFDWAGKQDPRIQALANSNDPKAVAHALRVYRASKGLPPPAVRVAARGPKPPKDAGLHAGTVRNSMGAGSPAPAAGNQPLSDAEAEELWSKTKVDD